MTKFSIIVPVYKDWERLEKCLKAISNQTFPNIKYEVIIINNGSKKDVPDYCNFSRNQVVIHESKPGSYVARNTGAKHATGEVLAFTDSDCIPDKDWLINADALFQDKSVDLIGGKVSIFKELETSELAYIYESFKAFRQEINVPNGHSVTANLMVRKKVFDVVNGFNLKMKSGGDWDFTERCVKKGFNMIYGESVIVNHPSRKNLKAILKKQFRFICWGTINTNEKHGHSYLRIQLSSFYNRLKNLFLPFNYPNSLKASVVIFLIDLIKLIHQILIGVLIVARVINPNRAR